MKRIMALEETTDHLGRILPGMDLETLLADSKWWTNEHVKQILARVTNPVARAQIVSHAAELGITHSPPDLAGHRYRFRA